MCAAIRPSSSLCTIGEVFPLPPPKKLGEEEAPLPLPTPTLPAMAENTPPPIAEDETVAPRRIGGCW